MTALSGEDQEGFFILVKRNEISEDGKTYVQSEGMARTRNVNRQYVLDLVLKSLDMDTKALLAYVSMRVKAGSDLDEDSE